jgi:hypothetical protein
MTTVDVDTAIGYGFGEHTLGIAMHPENIV